MYHVVILPIILLGLYLYNWSYSNANQEISRYAQVQLTSYLENLNREIEWMEIQQFDILQERELRKIALTWDMMDSTEKKSSINYILHRLTSIRNTSAYIKDISIHIRSIDVTISAVNAVQNVDHQLYGATETTLKSNQDRLIKNDDLLYLSPSVMGIDQEGEPLYTVQIELDAEKLKTSLDTLNMYPESGTFLLSKDWRVMLSIGEESNRIPNQYLNVERRLKDSTNRVDVDGSLYHFDKAYSEELGLFVVTYLPEEIVKSPLNKFSNWVWVFIVTSIVTIIIYSYSTYKLVHRPLLLLVDGFKTMESGGLDKPIKHEKTDEFGFIYDRYNKMLVKLKQLIDQDYKQKLMMQKAELKQLQSQINPHFLYNSFFILNSLAKIEDTERIEVFTKMLGEYFRFITRNGENEVSLEEEIKHARMYTEIQNLRFSRRIKVQFEELPEQMKRLKVPRLIVQPIIENAYEHSLEKMSDEGFLRIHYEVLNDEFSMIVEDNGDTVNDNKIDKLSKQIMNINEHQEQTGMINIHRRMVLTYGNGSGLFLSKSELGGLKVVIRIKTKRGE
ncbi:histidine kinase [Alkalihalobacillus sp. APA_J-10(15)]|nr:histidine kinase [Halalkalibacter sp. APA_J-10(15)]